MSFVIGFSSKKKKQKKVSEGIQYCFLTRKANIVINMLNKRTIWIFLLYIFNSLVGIGVLDEYSVKETKMD